ncbi:unnamed protein product [Paramecium primaurelia]|uniref:Uncharacterized protein n=1 Tax=Paramecium primaurelia TaxID=5886 RepID=A0A8S1NCJ9_PARPR|nr:unnamed protein product [Paramecium primaurelia]
MYDKLTILENVYFVEILIKNYFNSILNLNIKTILSTNQSWIRDFEIYYTLPEITFLSLNEGCQDQISDKCLNCREGWIEDEYQQNCIPNCGDTIIQGYEECDDGNLIFNDGCFQCKYQCIDSCKTCIFGICKLCLYGFVLNENNNNCEPLCGDGIVIPYSNEQCDIQGEKDQSSCKECRYISIPYCQQNNVCYPYCGDKNALDKVENFDDGDLTIYDNCIFVIKDFVDQNVKMDMSIIIIIVNRFVEIKLSLSKSNDDGDNIIFDGCFDCKYSCPENCHDCYQGSNQCKLQIICGDSFVQQQEECDDGNNQAADGCMNCLIQQNWICKSIIQDSPSQCIYVKAPLLVINYLNMTQNKQYLSIQFNQQVKVQTYQLLSKTISLKLVNIDNYNWNNNLQIIQDVGSYVIFGEYVLEIEIFQIIDFRLILKIQLNQSVVMVNKIIELVMNLIQF